VRKALLRLLQRFFSILPADKLRLFCEGDEPARTQGKE
jgi:hypothetical protein